MKISIITVNYNDKKGLEKTINSVVNQSFTGFEFLIIDGNSNDGSKEIIEKYQSKISYWVSEPDSGIYNAMNKGIKAAKGEYLLFLNSGDSFFDDNVLSKVSSSINSNKDIYYGDAVFKNDKTEFKVTYPEKLSFQFFTHNSLCHQATFINKNLFETVFLYNEKLKIISDWEFALVSICKQNCSYEHLNLVICYYDIEGISSNVNSKEKIKAETNQVIQNHFPAFFEDYEAISQLNNKRIKTIFHIQKFPFAWKMLKGFAKLLSIFLPKQK